MKNPSITALKAQASHTLIRAVHDELWRVREPERAAGQQRYMKSSMPFMGVRVPLMRKTARAVFDRYPPAGASEWRGAILALWHEARYREQRYAAVELAVHRPFLCWLNMTSVPLLDELIIDGAWWDYIDRIAPAGLGHVLAAEPKPTGAMMRGWAGGENIWRRRAALLCQLGRKKDTDLALLYDCVGACMGHRECFVQKAMGWALRDYAWTDPGEVRRYVAAKRFRSPEAYPEGSVEEPGVRTACVDVALVAVAAFEVLPTVGPTPSVKSRPRRKVIPIGGARTRTAVAPSGTITARTERSRHRSDAIGRPPFPSPLTGRLARPNWGIGLTASNPKDSLLE